MGLNYLYHRHQGQAASRRRLARRARTPAGLSALATVADQFDDDARRIDPASLQAMSARGRSMDEGEKAVQAELDRHGIERVPADVYLWGGYRYSNARNALAAARRKAGT